MNSDYIDAHHHFWIYEEELHSWITPQMGRIRRNFLPADFEPVLKANGFSGSILVQVDQSEDENLFQLRNAEENDFVKGLVGWIDLEARDISEKLDYYKDFKKMKGFRHILQGEVDRAMMLRPTFMNGIRHLTKFGFTYDILIYEDQLQYIPFIQAIQRPQLKYGIIVTGSPAR